MSSSEKERKIENSERSDYKRQRDDSSEDLRHFNTSNSLLNDEFPSKRSKTEAEVAGKSLDKIQVKNGLDSYSLNLPYDKIGLSQEEKIKSEEILDSLTSQIFKSDFKNSFLNAIWKLQIPIKYFDSCFRKTEIFNARPGIPCELMIDFSEKSEEFTLMMRLGEGETLEKEFETDKILNGSNQSLFDKISMQSEGVYQGQNHFIENQEKLLLNSSPTQNTQQEFMQDISQESTPFNNDVLDSLNATEITIKNINLINGSNSNDDSITKKKIDELKMTEKLKRDLEIKVDPDLLYFKLKPKQENENKENLITLESNLTSNPITKSNKTSLKPISNDTLKCNTEVESRNQLQDCDLEEWFNTKIDVQLLNFKWENFTNTKVAQGENITHKFKFSKKLYPNKTNDQDIQIIIIDISVIKNNIKKTGYLGLVNEGMTCYMNSMLQTLNILGYFKSAVFKIPRITSEDSPTNCVAYSLQKIFFELMSESKPISTLGLVKSFGWGREQLLVQHDVQEFNLKLSDIMEAKMKGTEVEGTFKYLFEGRAHNYINCINVDYKSLKEENFNDLQLTIKGCRNIYESFDKYTEEEILDNENMYEAEGHGKQIANKGIKFFKLPNVLVLQLKRFEYNFRLDRMEKVNDYFEFYEKINLAKYIVEPRDSEKDITNKNHLFEENNYSLHSVMVHSGSANAGHYFAFIKPYINSKWIKFNDENVKFVDEYEVFSNNFGGTSKIYKHLNRDEISEHELKNDFNAYILVYIKDLERENILKRFTIQDVPINFTKSFEHEKIEEKRMMLMNLRQSYNFNICLFSKEILVGKNNLGILNPYHLESGYNSPESIKSKMILNLPKNLKIFEFINFISEISSIPRERIQLYKYVYLYPLNILKKNIYKMIYIDEKFHVNTMLDILEIKPCKMYLLYIHINNQIEHIDFCGKNNVNINYSIFKQNEHYDPVIKSNAGRNKRPLNEEEFIINEEKNQVIFFNKKENFWHFNQNNKDNNLNSNYLNQTHEFKSPYEQTDSIKSKDSNKDIELIDDFCICVIKFLTFNSKNIECKYSLVIDDIISIRKNSALSILREKINFHEKYKKYLDDSLLDLIPDYNSTTVNFNVEFTTLEEFNNLSEVKKLEKKFFIANNENPVSNFKNDAACLIVNLKWKEKIKFDNKELLDFQPLIQEASREIHNTVNLPFIFIQDRRRELTIDFLKGKKMKLKVDWSEQEIKNFLHKEILSNIDFLDEMLDLKGLQYNIFSRTGKMQEFFEYLQNNINLLELIQYGERDREYMTLSENFPLLKYACKKATNMNSIFIPFYFNFIPRDFISSWQLINITLYDIYNNPIKKLGLILNRNFTKCNQILNFMIENNILHEFYNLKNDKHTNYGDFQDIYDSNHCKKSQISQESEIINYNLESQNLNNYDKDECNKENSSDISNKNSFTPLVDSDNIFSSDQFLFLCYNSQTEIIYDLFYSPNEVLKKYENDPRILIDYRLQPFSHDELVQIKDESKIFIAVMNKEIPICDPFMAFFELSKTTVATMKLNLVNKLKKIKKIQIYLDELGLTPNDLNNSNKIKFFTSTLFNYKPIKKDFFNSDTDEDLMSKFMISKQANNILIELPTSQNNTYNSNIILLNSA